MGMSRNDGHNILSTEVVFFKGTPVENALGMSALTPLTIEHGMVNDELMYWFFAYYQTYGPQNAFEECVIANSFMWQQLNSHVSAHGATENSLKAFVERRLAKRHTRFNTLIVPICDSLHWSLMILERGKYYHMNPKPDYEPHSNNPRMRIWFAKCWEIMQGNYNGNEVDDSILDKWMQPNVPTQTGSWECGWFVLKYFDKYIQQRFGATEMEQFEQVSNTLCTTFM
jgi:Ulp1 family protease